jgi:hypothetical protein
LSLSSSSSAAAAASGLSSHDLEDEEYFVHDSQQWKNMWYQLSAYGRYNSNCYDVPMEHEGVSNISLPSSFPSSSSISSPVVAKPMSLGRWVARLKDRFMRQQLCPTLAALVTSLVVKGELTLIQVAEKTVIQSDCQALNTHMEPPSTRTVPTGGVLHTATSATVSTTVSTTSHSAPLSLPLAVTSETSSPPPPPDGESDQSDRGGRGVPRGRRRRRRRRGGGGGGAE